MQFISKKNIDKFCEECNLLLDSLFILMGEESNDSFMSFIKSSIHKKV